LVSSYLCEETVAIQGSQSLSSIQTACVPDQLAADNTGAYQMIASTLQVHPVKNEKRKSSFIPVPDVKLVPTYPTDYLPTHKITLTYLKAPVDKSDKWDDEAYEYDLDVEDCEFLNNVNQETQDRLTAKQLERMIWELEVLNHQAAQQSQQLGGMGHCVTVLYFCGADLSLGPGPVLRKILEFKAMTDQSDPPLFLRAQ
jgi:hypothetical protein